MQKPWFVLSPCGTSLLTNAANDIERKLVSKYANHKSGSDIPAEETNRLSALIERVRGQMAGADHSHAAKASAELNAIIKLYQGEGSNPQHFHQLLCTDTWLGETTATLVAEWLRGKGFTANVKRQTDLQTADLQAFQLALSDLVQWCHETLPAYQQNRYRIIFNLTGGFKSVQGFLQTLAMFYANEAVYIFETGRELLRIPRLPITMNAEGVVRDHLQTFRRLALGLEDTLITGIPETLLLQIADEITLSAWGSLVWEQAKRQLYAEGLHPSPSAKLRFGKQFEKDVVALAKERCVIVNERIDQLVRCLEKNGKYNPPSLNFKAIEGGDYKGSTHECDAWADRDAKRIFGHFEGGVLVVDRIITSPFH